MTEFQILFHVTPKANFHSIMDRGVLPSFSQGKRPVCWYCTADRLNWALSHISNKRGLPVSQLVVFRAVVETVMLKRTCWQGVYQAAHVVRPSGIIDLEHFLSSPDNGI